MQEVERVVQHEPGQEQRAARELKSIARTNWKAYTRELQEGHLAPAAPAAARDRRVLDAEGDAVANVRGVA